MKTKHEEIIKQLKASFKNVPASAITRVTFPGKSTEYFHDGENVRWLKNQWGPGAPKLPVAKLHALERELVLRTASRRAFAGHPSITHGRISFGDIDLYVERAETDGKTFATFPVVTRTTILPSGGKYDPDAPGFDLQVTLTYRNNPEYHPGRPVWLCQKIDGLTLLAESFSSADVALILGAIAYLEEGK